jgi:hypothetical protein
MTRDADERRKPENRLESILERGSELNEVQREAVGIVLEELSDRGRSALGHLLRNAVFPLRLELERDRGDREETLVLGAFAHILAVVDGLTE